MKFTSILPIFAASASIAGAKSLLAVFNDRIIVGETYEVEWLSDNKQKLELKLVHKEPYGWRPITDIFSNKMTEPMGGNYSWTVSKKTPTGEGYALWLSGDNVANPGTGYADLTQWFEILPAEDTKEDLK